MEKNFKIGGRKSSLTPSTALLNQRLDSFSKPRMLTEYEIKLLRQSKKEIGEVARKRLIYEKIREYVKRLEKSKVPVWRLYLYGSYSKNTFHPDSDIDLAVFWDQDDIDGLDEDVRLRRLSWDIDLRIEPHSFARTDFDETNPFVREIITMGERIV